MLVSSALVPLVGLTKNQIDVVALSGLKSRLSARFGGMAALKTLPDGMRSVCSLPLHPAACDDVMVSVRRCFGEVGVVTKSRAFSATAQVFTGDALAFVVVKARIYSDSQGTFLDLTRRRGDGILFMGVFGAVQESLRSLAPSLPAHSPRPPESRL